MPALSADAASASAHSSIEAVLPGEVPRSPAGQHAPPGIARVAGPQVGRRPETRTGYQQEKRHHEHPRAPPQLPDQQPVAHWWGAARWLAHSSYQEGAPLAHVKVAHRVLIIVQNLPVPFDRRVWLECQALISAGYQVAVVCPKGKGDPAYKVVDTVELYKYRPYAPGGSKLSFVAEYGYSFLATAWHTLKARRKGRFAVIQACNPPDIFWPIALVFRLERTKFVFDHHDLCPELFQSRFPGGPRLPYLGLRWLERRTHRTADHVISTNNSYREIAINRSGKSPSDVTVVRTGPNPDRLRRGEPDPAQKRGRRYLAAYIGVMGPQDGVDIVVRAAHIILNEFGRDDIAFTLIGSGDCFDELVALRDELGLADHVEFTGRAPDELVARIMSTADVGSFARSQESAQ